MMEPHLRGFDGAYSDLKRLTTPPVWREAYASVNPIVIPEEPRRLLEELFRLYQQAPSKSKKALALLTKVNFSQPGKWERALEEDRAIPLRMDTREAIASILRGEEGAADEWEAAASHLRATLEEMEAAARLRRELARLARATEPPEDANDPTDEAERLLRGGRESEDPLLDGTG